MRKKRVLFYGDSNTHGYNAVTHLRWDEGVYFTSILKQRFHDVEILEAGLNSRTTDIDDDEKNFVNGLKCIEATVFTHTPLDMIVIMLGSNDFKIRFHRDVKDSIKALETIVTYARQDSLTKSDTGKEAEILLVSPIQYSDNIGELRFKDDFNEESKEKLTAFIDEVEVLAKSLGVHYLKASDYAAPCKEDGLHMDEKSHKALADIFEIKIKEILKM